MTTAQRVRENQHGRRIVDKDCPEAALQVMDMIAKLDLKPDEEEGYGGVDIYLLGLDQGEIMLDLLGRENLTQSGVVINVSGISIRMSPDMQYCLKVSKHRCPSCNQLYKTEICAGMSLNICGCSESNANKRREALAAQEVATR